MEKVISIFTIFVLCLLTMPVLAQVPILINFQGKLTDPNKAPIEGQVDIKFSIYDAETGGNLLWEENHSGVTVTNGIFNILLGSGSTVAGDLSTTFTGADRWLEVKIGTGVPMTPRQRIASVAYSIHSKDADNALSANDVPSKDITPKSVTISGVGTVINSQGQWVGDPTGLVGPQGPAGPQGLQGPAGPQGPKGDTGAGQSKKICSVLVYGSPGKDLVLNVPNDWDIEGCRQWCLQNPWTTHYQYGEFGSNGQFINVSPFLRCK